MEGISKAIGTGMSRKLQGEKAVEAQKAVLLEKEKGMGEIREKLMQIRGNLSDAFRAMDVPLTPAKGPASPQRGRRPTTVMVAGIPFW